MPLVLTGSAQKAQPKVLEQIKVFQLSDQVHFLGYIDSQDMPAVYQNAAMLLFPSLFEGFGIPLVEAMRRSLTRGF